jgi:anthranilate phosphoribosyltransferase
LELEIVIDNIKKQKTAEEKIRKVAQELRVKIMTEKEITEFAKKIDQKYKNLLGPIDTFQNR